MICCWTQVEVGNTCLLSTLLCCWSLTTLRIFSSFFGIVNDEYSSASKNKNIYASYFKIHNMQNGLMR